MGSTSWAPSSESKSRKTLPPAAEPSSYTGRSTSRLTALTINVLSAPAQWRSSMPTWIHRLWAWLRERSLLFLCSTDWAKVAWWGLVSGFAVVLAAARYMILIGSCKIERGLALKMCPGNLAQLLHLGPISCLEVGRLEQDRRGILGTVLALASGRRNSGTFSEPHHWK